MSYQSKRRVQESVSGRIVSSSQCAMPAHPTPRGRRPNPNPPAVQPCLASSHVHAIRTTTTATAESGPEGAFAQPVARSRVSQNNSHPRHATRQDASRQEVSRLSPLSTFSQSTSRPRAEAHTHTPEHAGGTPARQHEPSRLSALAGVRQHDSRRAPAHTCRQHGPVAPHHR